MLTTQRCRGMFLTTALILGPVGGLAHPLPLAPEGPPPAIRSASGHPDEPALAPEINPLVTLSLAQGWAIGTPRPCSALQAARPLSNPVLKTIAEGMPHKCDDYLWGRWLCGELYHDGDPERPIGLGWYVTLSQSITPEGFERIRYQRDSSSWLDPGEDIPYTVDRKWHPYPNPIFDAGGDMLKRASCNGVSPDGWKYLMLSHKRADGTKDASGWVEYYRSNRLNWIYMQRFKYNPETKSGDPVSKLILCERQSP